MSSAKISFPHILIRALLILLSFIIVLPFLFMLMNSFKTTAEYTRNIWALPGSFNLDNYELALERTQLMRYAINSLVVVTAALVVNIAFASSVSYVITRMGLKSARKIYSLFLVGLLIPHILAIIPLFFVSRIFFLYNTRLMLVIAYAVFELPFAVFVMCAFFKTLPTELEEAARIDGAGYFATFLRIMLPLAKPGLITVVIFNFLEYWSEYILALTLIADESKKTISLAILRLQVATSVKTEWGAVFAACIMFILPVLVIYCAFQSKLTEGLTAGSIKG